MEPTIGRIVHYRSRTGKYTVPAIITATTETLNPEGVEAGYVSALSSSEHVHLTVFSPGTPGLRLGAEDFVVPESEERPVAENVGGSYQEWDVPRFVHPSGLPAERGDTRLDVQAPGTWRWPVRT
jgi:hypothetical protein